MRPVSRRQHDMQVARLAVIEWIYSTINEQKCTRRAAILRFVELVKKRRGNAHLKAIAKAACSGGSVPAITTLYAWMRSYDEGGAVGLTPKPTRVSISPIQAVDRDGFYVVSNDELQVERRKTSRRLASLQERFVRLSDEEKSAFALINKEMLKQHL